MWSYTFNGPPILDSRFLDSRFDITLYTNAMPKLHHDDIVSEMMYDLRYEVRKEIKDGWAFDCERKLDDIG